MKPKCSDLSLVVGCSIGYIAQSRNSDLHIKSVFRSYHGCVCSGDFNVLVLISFLMLKELKWKCCTTEPLHSLIFVWQEVIVRHIVHLFKPLVTTYHNNQTSNMSDITFHYSSLQHPRFHFNQVTFQALHQAELHWIYITFSMIRKEGTSRRR